eukprot:Gb_16671 [translate_table: standard]
MSEPVDWAPFSNHGEVYKRMAPKEAKGFVLETFDNLGSSVGIELGIGVFNSYSRALDTVIMGKFTWKIVVSVQCISFWLPGFTCDAINCLYLSGFQWIHKVKTCWLYGGTSQKQLLWPITYSSLACDIGKKAFSHLPFVLEWDVIFEIFNYTSDWEWDQGAICRSTAGILEFSDCYGDPCLKTFVISAIVELSRVHLWGLISIVSSNPSQFGVILWVLKQNWKYWKVTQIQGGDKMVPESWMSPNQLRINRSLQTSRMLNPLDPKYKLASGFSFFPGVDDRFPNRVTDIMDTSDIPGTKAESHYSRPVRLTRLEAHADDVGSHPVKHTHMRTRVSIGQGLDLSDIDIGKKQYGFRRTIISSPLEPMYPNEKVETSEEKNMRLKKGIIQPRKCKKSVVDKVSDKIYWKSEQLPLICKEFDPLSGNMIGHKQFRLGLEKCGVKLSDQEFEELISYTDKEQEGLVNYKDFERAIRLNGLEKDPPKPLGIDLGVHGSPSSFGQGLQVLVDSQYRGKHILQGADYLEQFYNPVTGETRQNSLLTLSKEPHHSSYKEKVAALLKQRRAINFTSFMPSEYCHLKFPDTHSSEMPLQKNSSVSVVISSGKNCPAPSEGRRGRRDIVIAEASKLQKSQTDLSLQGLQTCEGESIALVPKTVSTLPVIKKRFDQECKFREPKVASPTSRNRYTHAGLTKAKDTIWNEGSSKKSGLQNFKQRLMSERRIAEIQAVQFL